MVDGPDNEHAMRARLDALKGALDRRKAEARAKEPPAPGAPGSPGDPSGYLVGMSAAGEFVGAIVAGALIGWGLDWLTGKKPWFLILFFLLGMVGGIANVIRVAGPKRPARERNSPLSGAPAPDKDGQRPASAAALGAPTGADDDED
jgi:F0F1-type ATP synthase assembly protein I